MHHLCTDNIFCRLDFQCSDGCFPKLTPIAKRHIEMSCCVVQGLSEERVPSDLEAEQHNNSFQYGALLLKSIWASSHPNIEN